MVAGEQNACSPVGPVAAGATNAVERILVAVSLLPITPLVVRVHADWLSGRPRRLRLADVDVPILAIERVRDESSAYPAASGPRTTFGVRTPTGRLVLTFEHRPRRWLIEELDPEHPSLGRAA